MKITNTDIGWVAGFLEGEGSFGYHGRTPRITVGQVQRQPLERLSSLCGGHMYLWTKRLSSSSWRSQPIWLWALGGQHAAAVMMSIWILMSPNRRAKIQEVLAHWKARPPKNGMLHACCNGHEFTPLNSRRSIRANGTFKQRVCRICERARYRHRRQLQLNARERLGESAACEQESSDKLGVR